MNTFEKQLQDAVDETSHFPEGSFDRGFHIGLSVALDRYRKCKEDFSVEALYHACHRMLSDEVTGGTSGPWQGATRAALIEMEAAVKLYEDNNYDPTPWCSGCGSKDSKNCHCGPISKDD